MYASSRTVYSISLFLSVLLVLANLSPASAWGSIGHKAVAGIAMKYVSPHTAEQVQDVLGHKLNLTDITPLPKAYDSKDANYQWSTADMYVYVPEDAGEVDVERDCQDRCTITAITEYANILRSIVDPYFSPSSSNSPNPQRVVSHHLTPSANPLAKNEGPIDSHTALSFLLHYVADIHQPLHVGYQSDKGGEAVAVRFMGGRRAVSLHEVWDRAMLELWLKQTQRPGDWQALVDHIDSTILSPHPQQVRGFQHNTDPAKWAEESFLLSRLVAYSLPGEREGERGRERDSGVQVAGEIDREYYARGLDLSLKRIGMAGVRLATLLDDIFHPRHGNAATGTVVGHEEL